MVSLLKPRAAAPLALLLVAACDSSSPPGNRLLRVQGEVHGSTLGASDLTGDGSCFVPSKPVRFFEGAVLTEVLPP